MVKATGRFYASGFYSIFFFVPMFNVTGLCLLCAFRGKDGDKASSPVDPLGNLGGADIRDWYFKGRVSIRLYQVNPVYYTKCFWAIAKVPT